MTTIPKDIWLNYGFLPLGKDKYSKVKESDINYNVNEEGELLCKGLLYDFDRIYSRNVLS